MRFLRRGWWLTLALLGGMVPAVAQVPPQSLPQNLVVPFQPVGARAAGMGGAFVSVARGVMAGAWNPAGIYRSRGLDWGLDTAARVENLDTEDVRNFINDLRDAIENQSTQEGFNSLRNFAQGTGGQPIVGVLTPSLGISIGDFLSLNTYVQGSGHILMLVQDNPNVAGPDQNRVNMTGAGFAYGAAQVSVAQRLWRGTVVGLGVKYLGAYYRPFAFNLDFDPGTGNVASDYNANARVNTDSHDTALTFDLGLLWEKPNSTTALVVRNVNTPKLQFENPNAAAGTIEVALDPEIDFGWAIYGHERTTTFAFELHNIGGRNNGPLTVHIGLEQRLGDFFTLRTGVSNGNWTGGLSLHLGGLLRLDAAIGEAVKDYAAVGLRLNF